LDAGHRSGWILEQDGFRFCLVDQDLTSLIASRPITAFGLLMQCISPMSACARPNDHHARLAVDLPHGCYWVV